jgi:hypothetical protein
VPRAAAYAWLRLSPPLLSCLKGAARLRPVRALGALLLIVHPSSEATVGRMLEHCSAASVSFALPPLSRLPLCAIAPHAHRLPRHELGAWNIDRTAQVLVQLHPSKLVNVHRRRWRVKRVAVGPYGEAAVTERLDLNDAERVARRVLVGLPPAREEVSPMNVLHHAQPTGWMLRSPVAARKTQRPTDAALGASTRQRVRTIRSGRATAAYACLRSCGVRYRAIRDARRGAATARPPWPSCRMVRSNAVRRRRAPVVNARGAVRHPRRPPLVAAWRTWRGSRRRRATRALGPARNRSRRTDRLV